MPPRKRAPFRAPARPTGTYSVRKPDAPEVCMIDGCSDLGALFAAGPRCPTHRPDYEKYLAAWLAGCRKGETA